MPPLQFPRREVLDRVEASIRASSRARIEMGFILGATTTTAVAASYVLLRSGMDSMWLRYALSVLPAYLTYFLLVGLWVYINKRHYRDPKPPDAPAETESLNPFEGLEVFEGLADEGCFFLFVIALVLSLGFVAYVALYTAPGFLAELILEAAFAGSLYRPLHHLPIAGWARLLLRRTIWILLFAAFCMGIIGGALGSYAPEARSIGGVLEHWRNHR